MKDEPDTVVMIVGEDSEFVYLMQRYVTQQGCHTLVARPDPEMIDVVRRRSPQAILIDVESSQATGWDALKKLKADIATQDIPVVICSWLDETARSLQEGAMAHLRKPVMYEDVSAALTDAGVQASET